MSIKVEATVRGPSPGELNTMLTEICQDTLVELFGRFQGSLDAVAWEWPRETQRRVGVVGSPRNIIDTGNLKQSGHYTFLSATTMEATWSASYAAAVHEGARLRNGTILPARPWSDAVMGRVQAPGIPVYPLGEKLRQRILTALAGA